MEEVGSPFWLLIYFGQTVDVRQTIALTETNLSNLSCAHSLPRLPPDPVGRLIGRSSPAGMPRADSAVAAGESKRLAAV
jgi:hypothetical protein